jgi:hypothetical protein
MKGQESHELLFWIIIALLIAMGFLLFANQIIFGYMEVKTIIKPP